jgi:membrane protein implicated in regulation of membrane protease activity
VGLTKIIFVLLVALAGWYLYRRFIADAMKLAKASQAKRSEQKTGATGTLVQDPVTGEYRVRRSEES